MIDIITLLLITIPIGILGALTGLGGGSILTPILVALGVPVKYAIAASMVSIIATSNGSAAHSVREGIANVKAGMYLGMYTVVGAIIGATVAGFVDPRVLYFAFAAFLMTSYLRLREHFTLEVPDAMHQDRVAKWLQLEGEYHDRALGRKVVYKLTRPIAAGGGMLVAGLAAGMLGIGESAFKV